MRGETRKGKDRREEGGDGERRNGETRGIKEGREGKEGEEGY